MLIKQEKPTIGNSLYKPRLIAFYLPQFHPIPENDRCWGPGFTEWTNVAKAKPLFSGHWQPRLPADLGFYDLRVPEVREAQAALARSAKIEGFCYWHYWFGGGRRILERPFNEVLETGRPDFPFCLAWANQSWSGIWHGNPKKILLEQTYPGRADEAEHFQLVLKAFRDGRYMKVDGKPIFVIFRPQELPSSAKFIEHWRELELAAGLPGLFFVAISNLFSDNTGDGSEVLAPFDAVTQSAPDDFLKTEVVHTASELWRFARTGHLKAVWNGLTTGARRKPARFKYKMVVERALDGMPRTPRYMPCVVPNWDNTPRSSRDGIVYEEATPKLFSIYLDKALKHLEGRNSQSAIIFIKSWNEWAEGNYLEPDARYGHAFLDVVHDAMAQFD